MGEPFQYVGAELTIFAHARQWKRYFGRILAPHLGCRVLEVGAGLGATTSVLCTGRQEVWYCLEPDPSLRAVIDSKIAAALLPSCCRSLAGTVTDLPSDLTVDSVLYLDALEHIPDDREELAYASARLAPGGSLVVLAPAYPFLFSPFDTSVGHVRRYTRASLTSLAPPGCALRWAGYLDTVGILPSLANRLALKQPLPSQRQILFWDRCLVPISRLLDPLLRYSLGRSVLAIWENRHLWASAGPPGAAAEGDTGCSVS